MFRLEKSFRFEAAHRLPNHNGKCRRLHGHSWVGTMVVEGEELYPYGSSSGMLVDFGDLSIAVENLIDQCLDHHYLNESTGLENPTSEELARWIFNQLKPVLPLLR